MPILLLTVFTCVAVQGQAPRGSRLNVLLICVDDLKPAIGAYGVKDVHTPNLDRLASWGITFERAYCNQAICAPSRNSLLTGSRSTSLGVYSLATNFRKGVPDAITLPQVFRQHGYETESMGKIFHTGHGNSDDAASWSIPREAETNMTWVLPKSQNPEDKGKKGPVTERADVDDESYGDGVVATKAVRRLKEYSKGDQPFFLAVGFRKPHLPFCAPEKYWRLYDPQQLPLPSFVESPKNAPAVALKGVGEVGSYSGVPSRIPFKDDVTRNLIHGYYAAVSYMDAQVGRVLDALEQSGQRTNTIVVLWGDHGFHLGDHGLWSKHTNYEEANRIPLLITAPNVTTPGTRSAALVETVDIYPTVCELAGLSAPQGPQRFDGTSLVSVLKNPEVSVKSHVYHCFPRKKSFLGRAIRTDRYRLVEWKEFGADDSTAEYELYDYVDDPLEKQNLAALRSDVLSEMLQLLKSHPPAKPPVEDNSSSN